MKRLVLGPQAIVFGRGTINYLDNIDAKKAFIVTGGKSMFDNGTIAAIESTLHSNSCETYVHSGVKKNPDTNAVLSGVAAMKKINPDLIIAVGGGSPLDAAKVMALFYEYPHLNFENALSAELPDKRKNLKFIAIPSTSGTASEVTKSAVITFKEKNLKIGLKTEAFIPDLAILDANLTMTMPDNVVAETGMDAVTHAVECFINKNADDFSGALAKEAVEGLFKYLPISYKEKSFESREKVHNYQCMAGLAFANVGLGMAHGISHAVGGKFDLGHGLINAIVLPYVLAFNAQDEWVDSRLKTLAQAIQADDFIEEVRRINSTLKIPCSFKDAGIDLPDFEESFSELVANSLKGSTRVNPVQVTESDMQEFLKSMYWGKRL